jgi:hypothetical protein
MKKLLLLIGFASLTVNAQVPSYVPTDGLVGYWPFNGNANDISGNANNGVNNGATLTTDRFGNTNCAYIFNGTNSYIEISDNTTLDLTSDFSISSWFNANSFTDPVKMILSKHRNSNNDGGYVCGIWNPNQIVNFQASPLFTTQTYPIGNSGNVLVNNWYNLIITYQKSSGTFKYYLNGLVIDSKILTFNILNTTEELIIGAERLITGTGVGYVFSGKIDDVGIWAKVLTSNEILSLYQAEVSCETLVINSGTLSSFNPPVYQSTITIYPNPANDQITIDCGNLANVVGYHIEIVNTLGQVVFNQPMNTQQYNVALNTWSGTGIYFVKIYDASNTLLNTKKIILQ